MSAAPNRTASHVITNPTLIPQTVAVAQAEGHFRQPLVSCASPPLPGLAQPDTQIDPPPRGPAVLQLPCSLEKGQPPDTCPWLQGDSQHRHVSRLVCCSFPALGDRGVRTAGTKGSHFTD